MHRDERGRLPPGEAALETGIDRGMVGGVDLVEPPRALRLGEPEIRRHGAPFALAHDQAFRLRRAIAVDDEAGRVGPEQRSVESHREAPGDAERPGIPGDMGRKRVFGKSEGHIRVRDAVRGMIADEDERPGAVWIFADDQAASPTPALRVLARLPPHPAKRRFGELASNRHGRLLDLASIMRPLKRRRANGRQIIVFESEVPQIPNCTAFHAA